MWSKLADVSHLFFFFFFIDIGWPRNCWVHEGCTRCMKAHYAGETELMTLASFDLRGFAHGEDDTYGFGQRGDGADNLS